ncbi:hypothetical protein C8J57DRAFT_1212094 [Mycena rebaudengoi]|nr:hypothetical protein C8J57DRAFT_1212094 [Mycena rebaudengoi]
MLYFRISVPPSKPGLAVARSRRTSSGETHSAPVQNPKIFSAPFSRGLEANNELRPQEAVDRAESAWHGREIGAWIEKGIPSRADDPILRAHAWMYSGNVSRKQKKRTKGKPHRSRSACRTPSMPVLMRTIKLRRRIKWAVLGWGRGRRRGWCAEESERKSKSRHAKQKEATTPLFHSMQRKNGRRTKERRTPGLARHVPGEIRKTVSSGTSERWPRRSPHRLLSAGDEMTPKAKRPAQRQQEKTPEIKRKAESAFTCRCVAAPKWPCAGEEREDAPNLLAEVVEEGGAGRCPRGAGARDRHH